MADHPPMRTVRRGLTAARRELALVRELTAGAGLRGALLARARALLELDGVDVAELAAAKAELRALRAKLSQIEDEVGVIAQIPAVEQWVSLAPASDTLVSVILPTHNRAAQLARAIESIRAQVHERWELIVVDDRSTDSTPQLLAALRDPRVTATRVDAGNSAASRNAGLARARGDVIVYLDDDNVMAPLWCKAVVWAFDRFPAHGALYGARIIEEGSARPLPGELPAAALRAFDRRALERTNYIDMGVIAHRRDHPEGHLDESLPGLRDWDLILRLTEESEPLVLPVVACLYTTGAVGRESERSEAGQEWAGLVRSRMRARAARASAA